MQVETVTKQEIILQDTHIEIQKLTIEKGISIELAPAEYIGIIGLKENHSCLLNSNPLKLREKHSCIFYSSSAQILSFSNKQFGEILLIRFKTSFLESQGLITTDLVHILTRIEQSTPVGIHNATAYTKSCEMLNTHFATSLQPVFLKAKTIHLFCVLVDNIITLQQRKKTTLRAEDISKVIQAKRLIEENLNENYTIEQLARTVGTNEQYLKKHFKQFFGKTIFNFSNDCKMNQAKLMIKNGNLKISKISESLGYKHATHFTTAFKKFFGYVPNSLRLFLLPIIEEVEILLVY